MSKIDRIELGGDGTFPGTLSAMVDPAKDPEWHECMLGFIDDMQKTEQRLRDQGYSFSLIDPEPMAIPSFDLDTFIDRPIVTTRRRWRLDLIGGGQICIVEWFKARFIKLQSPDLRREAYHDRTVLAVTAHVNGQIRKFTGRTIEIVGEAMMMGVAVYGPQEIADRVAATLRAVNNTPENFFALLSHRTRCAICNRPLADEVSKLVSVGPDCARRHRIPHSLDAAARRLELRRKLGL